MDKYVKDLEYYNTKIKYSSKYTCDLSFQDTFVNVDDIYVIGDIHGDLSVLIKTLKKCNLIDKSMNWIGNKAHLVQLGDILDGKIRNNILSDQEFNSIIALEEYAILEFLNDLDQQARKIGGRVHYLIGNHELMNVLGEFDYVLDKHMSYLGEGTRRILFQPGGYMSNMLACHSYSILKINDWIFCHGGLLPQHIENNSITDINILVRDLLLKKKTFSELSQKEKEIIFGDTSIFWTRYYKFNTNKCNSLNNVLEIINSDSNKGGLILGHTPHINITTDCNDKLYFADVGLSRSFDSKQFKNLEVLYISKNSKPRIIS